MTRLTTRNGPDGVVTDADASRVLARLAAFEDLYDEVLAQDQAIPAELVQLRAAGKQKTVRYRELFAQKLLNDQIVAMFRRHSIA